MKNERLVQSFIEMAEISSPSFREREIADYLIDKLKALGMEVIEDDAGEKNGGNSGNIIGVLDGKSPAILFSAHMDTVNPCENVQPEKVGEYIITKGDTILGADDKAGIAAILEAITTIKENEMEHPKIIVVFSIAEEIRLIGAKYVNLDNHNIKYGFILDSNGKPGTVVKKAPYHEKLTFTFIGKAAHAGIEPEKGKNALFIAANAISKLKLGRLDYETTFNLGIINGGTATNIVMPEVKIMGECRCYNEEKLNRHVEHIAHICEETVKLHEGEFHLEAEREYNGFEFSINSKIMNIVKKSATNLDLKFEAQDIGGGSDTNVYNEKGINTVNLGIGMTDVHSIDEKIKIVDLVNSTKMLFEIVKESLEND